jgi:class 3 adenylate cyclase
MHTRPEIRFTTTDDGVRIAYADTGGDGPPLLWTPGWVSHIELDWTTPEIASLLERLAANHRLVHFDGRGTGLSDRDVRDLSADVRVRDIEAVADAAGLESFDLFSWSHWGPAALLYTSRHPERVRRLVLYATFAKYPSGNRPELLQAVLALIRAEWTVGSRTIAEFVHPSIDHSHSQVFVRYFRASASAEVAASILEDGLARADARAAAREVRAPTTVLHRSEDSAISPASGPDLAGLIPGARFVPLAGNIHVPWHGDVDGFLRELERALGFEPAPPPEGAGVAHHAPRGTLLTLLFTDMEASTSLTERLGDAQAQSLVRDHNAIVRDALAAYEGREIKHTGDGIMAAFTSASAALECAIAVQRALARRNEAQPELPLRVRIGLNAGEPIVEENDLFGSSVQLASRICNSAAPGEILASNVVRELAAGKGFLFAARGELSLRGIEEPTRVYEVRWSEV